MEIKILPIIKLYEYAETLCRFQTYFRHINSFDLYALLQFKMVFLLPIFSPLRNFDLGTLIRSKRLAKTIL